MNSEELIAREYGLTEIEVAELRKEQDKRGSESPGGTEDSVKFTRLKVTSEELIRQGNVLIAAARDGKIGLSEDELKGLQKNYLRRKQLGDKIQFNKIVGIFASMSGLFVCMVGSEEGWLGFLFIIGGIIFFGDMYLLEQKARQYEELVDREYPRMDKKEAA